MFRDAATLLNASAMPEMLAVSEDLELAVPRCDSGIGDVILNLDSDRLIDGVRLQPTAVWPDDRGYFLEIYRTGKGLVSGFSSTTQVSAALSYPGTIKAFHYHLHQTDCWTAVQGVFQFVIVDLRRGSPTYGRRNTMYCGPLRPWQLLIPPGVAHGYKVVGTEPGMLVYATDQFYNPKDEGRIAYDDSSINYDWGTQHK